MLRRLALRDFAIVPALELDFHAGFSVLTGETGAGKSILIDALQLALGSRGDVGVVREGATRAEISAEFDSPASLLAWLDEAGFEPGDALLLRRSIDLQGKSRAWVNGRPATVAQLREAAEHLVDIHGQHAWQSLTKAASARDLLDAHAGFDAQALVASFNARKLAAEALAQANLRHDEIDRERDRLAWQLTELDKLAPADGEWQEMDAEHRRLAHAQSLMDAARLALEGISQADVNAEDLTAQALSRLQEVASHDAQLVTMVDALQGALAQLRDAAHGLASYLDHAELDPQRLAQLDARLSIWIGLARRYRRQPAELPALQVQWCTELAALDAAVDNTQLERTLVQADVRFRTEAELATRARRGAVAPLSTAVTQAMQGLGMAGGRFEVALEALAQPQSHGMETVEFQVAGHAGSTPRALAKVASGGELSRLALAIAVTALRQSSGSGTLIFDEVDAGIGGAVGDTVGALMNQLGQDRQVLAVTHLAQVAACADHHYVVAKSLAGGSTASDVRPCTGSDRVAEIARMLGGERMAPTSLAHAQAMLQPALPDNPSAPQPRSKA